MVYVPLKNFSLTIAFEGLQAFEQGGILIVPHRL
jgi:hypothetical protein